MKYRSPQRPGMEELSMISRERIYRTRLRLCMADTLLEWNEELSLGIVDDRTYEYLANALDYSGSVDFCTNFTDEHTRLLEMFTGPHGKALFKAWLIQEGKYE